MAREKISPTSPSPPKSLPTAKQAVPIQVQIACVKREIAMRKRMYPTWVAAKRMNVFKAEDEISEMQAVLATLESLDPKLL